MKKVFAIFLSILLSSFLYAQNDMPKIEASDFPGIKINRTESYNGNSLWGYIDGGADLYLEYGFSKLLAQEIQFNNNKYRVDIYKMNNAEGAFGIFSISKFKCSGKTIAKYSCMTEYQALAAKGSYYISVANEKGSEAEQKFAENLAEKILSQIKEDDYAIPSPFTAKPFETNVKFINGILAVQNSVSDMEGMFTDLKDYKFLISTVEDEGKYTTLALISFSNASDASLFYGRKSKRIEELSKDVKLKLKKESDKVIMYMETNQADDNKLYQFQK